VSLLRFYATERHKGRILPLSGCLSSVVCPNVYCGKTVRDRAILRRGINRTPYHVSSMDRSVLSVFTGNQRWRRSAILDSGNFQKYVHSDRTMRDTAIPRWGANKKPTAHESPDPSVFNRNLRWRPSGHFGFCNFQKYARNDRNVKERAIMPMHVNRNPYCQSNAPIHRKSKMAVWRPS